MLGSACGVFFAALAVLFGAGPLLIPRTELPPHALGHKTHFIHDLIPKELRKEIIQTYHDIGEFPSNANDLNFYETTYEHIGEARPFDGVSCPHPLLIPNKNRTLCILPGRIDVARHFFMHGGVEGRKEPMDKLVSRLLSFGIYIMNKNVEKYPIIEKLFNTEGFLNLAKSVCPPDEQILDPFQMNYIIQVPGQSVALHLDGIYYWGASRFVFPQWLLAVMFFSGIWQDKFVNQVQVVAYAHEWTDKRDGNFVYWNENSEPKVEEPTPFAGSGVDGSKTVHAAKIYLPEAPMPIIDKSKKNLLKHVVDDKWQVLSDNEVMMNYTTDDLRVSVVYRARCFKDEAEREAYHNFPKEQNFKLEEVLGRLISDLVSRGKLKDADAGWNMDRLDLAILLLDTYIKYPLPQTHIPYNYCAAGRLYPALAPFLAPFC